MHTHSVRFENMVLECIRMVLVFYPYSIVYDVYITTILLNIYTYIYNIHMGIQFNHGTNSGFA